MTQRSTALPRLLFLCTGNACRSQMAEGWARHLHSDRLEVRSAGTAPAGVDPRAVRVMAEAGVDLAGHRSKTVQEALEEGDFDVVVTVCDRAAESCPLFPGQARILHQGFEDPARVEGDDEAALATFRRVRDEIRRWVESLPAVLTSTEPAVAALGSEP
jgi:arsenate reductase